MILEDYKMLRQYRDLLVVLILAAFLVWATNLFGLGNPWLRFLLVLPFLLGTGYLVGAAIFPFHQLEGMERFLLSLGLSLIVLVLTGLLLHFSPSGLRAESWAGILFFIAAVAAGIAYFRRSMPHHTQRLRIHSGYRNPDNSGRDVDTMAASTSHLEGVDHRHTSMTNNRLANVMLVVALSLSVLIVGLSAGMTFLPAPQTTFQGYSMLWMLPVPPTEYAQVELGLLSVEFRPQTYQIDLYLGDQLVQQWENIQLAPQEQWTRRLDLNEYGSGERQLEARLYLANQTDRVYRLVRLTLPTTINDTTLGH
jgi:uncharacterized membrane protein